MNTLTFGLLITALFGPAQRTETLPPAVWHCAQPQWTKADLDSGEFTGSIEVDCTYKANSGGGFTQLKKHLIDATAQKAKIVHAGPKDETFEGLPSTYFDVTAPFESSGMSADIRGDQHIATDGNTKFVIAFTSTDVSGDGADLLKAMQNHSEIVPTGRAGEYKVRSTATMVVEKPGLVPAKMFKKQAMKKIEQGIPQQEKQLLEEAANNT